MTFLAVLFEIAQVKWTSFNSLVVFTLKRPFLQMLPEKESKLLEFILYYCIVNIFFICRQEEDSIPALRIINCNNNYTNMK